MRLVAVASSALRNQRHRDGPEGAWAGRERERLVDPARDQVLRRRLEEAAKLAATVLHVVLVQHHNRELSLARAAQLLGQFLACCAIVCLVAQVQQHVRRTRRLELATVALTVPHGPLLAACWRCGDVQQVAHASTQPLQQRRRQGCWARRRA